MARPANLPPAIVLAAKHSHGTRIRYHAGCRCVPCRAANSTYVRARYAARDRGEGDSLVDASTAREHLQFLSDNGIGRLSVHAASDVSARIIREITTGRKKQIRRSTEKRILGVSGEAVADSARVDSETAHQQIKELLGEGFSKAELAKRLGYKSKRLRIVEGNQMTARSAMRVAKFYRQIMAETA
jgi:hypothetical protein